MATLYSKEYMKKRETVIVISIVAGMLSAVIFLFAGKLVGDEFFVDLGRVVAAGALVLLLVNLWLVQRAGFCGGNVLEVNDGKVVAYLKDPFYYNQKTLRGSVFVPFWQEDVVVEKTLHLPVGGKLLSCSVRCEGRVTNFQRHYDVFLSPQRKEGTDLQQIVRTCMATFLQQQRESIVATFDRLSSSEEGVAVSAIDIQNEAERYLRKEMASFGFSIYAVTSCCFLRPLIIV